MKVRQEEEANERLSKIKIKNWTIGHKKRILKNSENLSKISKDSEKALMQSMWRQWSVTTKNNFESLLNSYNFELEKAIMKKEG